MCDKTYVHDGLWARNRARKTVMTEISVGLARGTDFEIHDDSAMLIPLSTHSDLHDPMLETMTTGRI